MMEIESLSCFRSSNTIPAKTSPESLVLTSPGRVTCPDSEFIRTPDYSPYHSSTKYKSNMVVEAQTHTFRPLTPDHIPETADKNEKVDLPEQRQQNVSLPPEGAVTPSSENHLHINVNKINFSENAPQPGFLRSPTSTDFAKSVPQNDFQRHLTGLSPREGLLEKGVENGLPKSTDQMSLPRDILSDKYRDRIEMSGLNSVEHNLPPHMDATDLSNGCIRNDNIDRSPPSLSPKASDFEMDFQNSPSRSSDKQRRRKPTLEDIVRRMKEVETDSEESGEEETLNRSFSSKMEEGGDEIDGDLAAHMTPRINFSALSEGKSNGCDLSTNKMEMGDDSTAKENDMKRDGDEDGKSKRAENMEEERGKDGEQKSVIIKEIPVPSSHGGGPADGKGDVLKQFNHLLMPPKNGWLHGAFPNSMAPFFPFQPSPSDMSFSPFMSPFDNKFSSPEVEKDYLKCQYCERTFRRQKNLENHIENTHHGKGSSAAKKPRENSNDMYFKCTHCPYTTKHQSNLYVHLRIHTGERPYICGACGVQYSQSHSLKSHIINKHDGIMTYYIKEKRTRSPRGLGYLQTAMSPGDPGMFKLPGTPHHFQPNLGPLPPTNGLHIQHSPQGQNIPPPQQSPLPPSSQGIQMSPAGIMPASHHSPVGPPHPSPRPPQHPPHMQHQQQQQEEIMNLSKKTLEINKNMDMELFHKALELSRNSQSYFPYNVMSSPVFAGKPSPPFLMNGHGPVSPYYNGLGPQAKQNEQQTPLPGMPPAQLPQKNHMPLQEIHENNNNRQSESSEPMDLRKNKQDMFEFAQLHDDAKCNEGPDCINCIHSKKLKKLRMNVVRMLSILVPNLNFEEKGINAEGDSVDELLRDVIDSNVHDEEMSE